MSQNGQYQLAVQNGSSTIRTSANAGLTWSSLTGANGLPAGALAYPQATASGTPNYASVSASANGQYQLVSVSEGAPVCMRQRHVRYTYFYGGWYGSANDLSADGELRYGCGRFLRSRGGRCERRDHYISIRWYSWNTGN
jgi:hypothetical protein